MAYQPSAEDFDIPDDEGYTPSAEDFEEEPTGNSPMEMTLTKATTPKEETGFKGIYHDVLKGLGHALKSGKGFIKDTPNMLEDLGQDLLEHPVKARIKGVGHVLAGGAELGKGVLNLPHDTLAYLGRKELIPEWLKKYNELPFTHIPEDTGLEKALGLEVTRPGEKLLHAIPEIAAAGGLGKSAVKGVYKAATAPSKEALFQRALRDNIKAAEAEQSLSAEQVKQLKDKLTEEFSAKYGEKVGTLTPAKQQEQINIKKHKLEANRPLTEIPEREVGEIPEAPDTKGMLESHKKAIEEAKSAAEENLGVLDNPSLKAGKKIKSAIENVKSSASDLYNAARNHYKDKKVVADNSADIKAATKELEALKDADELAPGYGSGTPEQKALEANIEALKGEKVNASDIFDLQRTLEKIAQDTRKKQYSGVSELDFKRLGGVADRLESHADKLAKQLESVGGKDVQKMITEANKGWRTFKQLTKENPVGKAALKGDVPSNALIQLAKDHPANDFLKGLVESDPELRKQLLAAYSGQANVNKLMKPSTVIKGYLESLPEVDEHVNALKNAISEYKAGESKASKIQAEHKALVDSMKKAAEEQKVRQDAIRESEKLKSQIEFHDKAIPKLKEKIKLETEKGHNVKKLKDELAEHERNLREKGGRLKELGNVILKIKGLQGFVNKFGL